MGEKKVRELKAKIKKLKARKLTGKMKKWRAAQQAEAEALAEFPAAPPSAPQVSPLAPETGFPVLPRIRGVAFAAAAAGVRYAGRTDVMLAHLVPGTTMAGVFTRSATRSASVRDAQSKVGAKCESGAAVLVNSGNANAFTGAAGMDSVHAITQAVGARLGLEPGCVFTASTGVIGEPLPHDRIIGALDGLTAALDPDAIRDAAHAIMTTDTFAKGAQTELDIDGVTVRIAGIAKGSGMIAPDMATMLAFVFTDADLDPAMAQSMLGMLNDRTFNCVTVDSDTSTSDMVLLAATGQSGAPCIADADSHAAQRFGAALHGVMLDLAQQVVRDGEGARKFIEVQVSGAADAQDARKVAFAIANSPLVKTAVAGEDANWGRVVMAVGKSGARADRDRLSIRFGDIEVATNGQRAPDYDEATASAYMKRAELVIGVDLGLGSGAATVWTCDLTHGYIDINADYRS